jgi:hypothetical protein
VRETTPEVQRQLFEAFELQILYDKAERRIEISATVSEAIADAFEKQKALTRCTVRRASGSSATTSRREACCWRRHVPTPDLSERQVPEVMQFLDLSGVVSLDFLPCARGAKLGHPHGRLRLPDRLLATLTPSGIGGSFVWSRWRTGAASSTFLVFMVVAPIRER